MTSTSSPSIPQPGSSPSPSVHGHTHTPLPPPTSILLPHSSPSPYSGIDPILLQGLADPRSRSILLKLDMELERFLHTTLNRLEFPPMSSYHRMLVHRAAHYFSLDHAVIQVPELDPTTGQPRKAVVVYRNRESRIPVLRFSDLVSDNDPPHMPAPQMGYPPMYGANYPPPHPPQVMMPQVNVNVQQYAARPPLNPPSIPHPPATTPTTTVSDSTPTPADTTPLPTDTTPPIISPPPVLKIMKRSPGTKKAPNQTPIPAPPAAAGETSTPPVTLSPDTSDDSKSERTIEEREEEYARARARIFGESGSPSPSTSPPLPEDTTPIPPPSAAQIHALVMALSAATMKPAESKNNTASNVKAADPPAASTYTTAAPAPLPAPTPVPAPMSTPSPSLVPPVYNQTAGPDHTIPDLPKPPLKPVEPRPSSRPRPPDTKGMNSSRSKEDLYTLAKAQDSNSRPSSTSHSFPNMGVPNMEAQQHMPMQMGGMHMMPFPGYGPMPYWPMMQHQFEESYTDETWNGNMEMMMMNGMGMPPHMMDGPPFNPAMGVMQGDMPWFPQGFMDPNGYMFDPNAGPMHPGMMPPHMAGMGPPMVGMGPDMHPAGQMPSPMMGPFPFPLPFRPMVVSTDYQPRHPPKSTELFDPKAAALPKPPTKKTSTPSSSSSKSLSGSSATPPAPRVSPPPLSKSSPLHNPPSQGARTSSKGLLYDYASHTPSNQYDPAAPSPVATPIHILEVCGLPGGFTPAHPVIESVTSTLKAEGAKIKWLDATTVVAIFKTSGAAKASLAQHPPPAGDGRESQGACTDASASPRTDASILPHPDHTPFWLRQWVPQLAPAVIPPASTTKSGLVTSDPGLYRS
eukprot:TRINITY_DN3341_c0_g1_i1.p1 TRINITY_DN3341_c0_g1~~TRINITY_DN3341_c0_g1_i1.p1  ORF type:complete len:853 (+),score=161.07 TRINITY_DN3341_c0_g1_i1:126-2684(+)